MRLKDAQQLTENMTNLKNYLDVAFRSIMNSVLMCPHLMCEAFSVLKDLAVSGREMVVTLVELMTLSACLSQQLFYFPDQREVCYSVISGFIFLRFFAPAILNPRLYEITDQAVDPVVNRTLTLISKTVQTIGNLVSCRCVRSIVSSQPHAPVNCDS